MKFSNILNFFTSSTFIIILAVIALDLFFWFLSPFLGFGSAHPFDNALTRIIIVSVVSIGGVVLILYLRHRKRKKDENLTNDIVASENTSSSSRAVLTDVTEMKQKLRDAMSLLRKSKLGQRHLFELPWYIMIGPPGAGKTTAIVNSGLKFPLAEQMGKSAIGGVGGTRNCDWWFTDNAVLVDTAGRYTTQESNVAADNAAWLGFLKLLRKHRKSQPINGAVIAISLSDLSMQDKATQKGNAIAVRKRLEELREELGVNFPVYILFTKADLIAGFSEFFETLGKHEREQVWGFTLSMSTRDREDSVLENFNVEFSKLLNRLDRLSLERIQEESDPNRRSLIAGFSAQVASIQVVAAEFLDEVFHENRYEEAQLFRGAYFTSGSQEGLPIDRLMQGMAQTFGIGRQNIGTGVGTGRSYFLTKLFDDVVFRESGLVALDDKAERKYLWLVRGALTASILLSMVIGALWFQSYSSNNTMITQAQQQIVDYKSSLVLINNEPISDSDLGSVVPSLNILLDMPGNPSNSNWEAPTKMKWGLYQGNKIGAEVSQVYRSSLNSFLLPRLLLDLENQLENNINDPGFLYETLKIYLILGKQGPMNKDLLIDWFKVDWERKFPDQNKEVLRGDLLNHLDSMLIQPLQEIDLNGPLVQKVRSILSEIPIATRAYNGIISSPSANSLPILKITDIGGPAVDRVLRRASGESLNGGIPGIFTNIGFNDVFLMEALEVADRIQSEGWVLGSNDEANIDEQSLINITRDVLDLYYNDYINRYDNMMADLDIISVNSIVDAAELANVLSGPTSPLVKILGSFASETELVQGPSSVNSGALQSDVGALAQNRGSNKMSLRNQLLLKSIATTAANSSSGEKPKEPGQYVADRFKWLKKFTASVDDERSDLDKMTELLLGLYNELNEKSFADEGDETDIGSVEFKKFQQASRRFPPAVRRWADQIIGESSSIDSDGTRADLNRIWQANVLPFCEKALTNRYPFTRHSESDVSLQDFGNLFSPSGKIQQFFDNNLNKIVDQKSKPWKWKKINGADLGISQEVLKQFETAQLIRDVFFNEDGKQPAIKFQLKFDKFAKGVSKIELQIDDKEVKFKKNGGANKPIAIDWPGSIGIAKISLFPKINWNNTEISREGAWGFYRLLDTAEINSSSTSDRTEVIFTMGRREVVMNLLSGSVLNPFSLKSINSFKCLKAF